jgi:predicted ATPase
MNAKTFVLTGGPQSGKTSIMRAIREHFGDRVMIIPEVATALIRELWPAVDPTAEHHTVWVKSLQRGIFHTQLGLEEIARARTLAEQIPLIGQDRGVFDNAAYLQISADELATQFGESKSQLMRSYDLVIHLDTLASISPESFGSATNAARYETAEEAIAVDRRLWKAYADHPNHIRVAASDRLTDKQQHVIELVAMLLD